MRAALVTLLLLCLTVPGLAAFDCASCQGLNCAFACTGPDRPPSEDDKPPPSGFELIFGDRPLPFGPGGKTVNLRDQVPAMEWAMAKREFLELVDFQLSTDVVMEILELTGGMPIAWSTTKGRTYIAVIGGDTPLYRVRPFMFKLKTPVLWILHNMISRGGCVAEVPVKYQSAVLQANNKRNCERR